MAEPFLAEMRIMSFNFAPKGWALCNGQLMSIQQNQALFSLLGTVYGGDGRVTFALPNLQGRVPIHMGNGHTLGEVGGQQTHTVTTQETPTHTHIVSASSAATGGNSNPAGRFLGGGNGVYHTPSNQTVINQSTLAMIGGSQPHNNLQPFLVLNISIALQGIFPSQT